MSDSEVLFKKPSYPINNLLSDYLGRFDRISKVPIVYDDLLRFSGFINVYDKQEEDTLWIRVYYNEFERMEIDLTLKKIYSLLHSDGNLDIIKFLNVDSIDYCTFGNSKPFRIKIRNILNDNYTHFYVKKADASRVYGLELEHILSPDKINFLVYGDTLVEEHIMGNDLIAPDEHVQRLKNDLYLYTNDLNFKNAVRMGNVLTAAFRFVTRNYKNPTFFKGGF